jgi:putative ABC transport system permease protein
MRQLRVLGQRLRSLFVRGRREKELAHEISLHLEALGRELMAEGMSEAEAAREAARQFGPVEKLKEECRDERRVNVIEDLARDTHFALRMFRKSPGFTLTALLSLALGIGANTAMFQLFDAVRLRSLPVERPEELRIVRMHGGDVGGNYRGRNAQFTNSLWEGIQRRQTSFASLFAYGDMPLNLAPSGEIRNAEGLRVSGGFFSGLGIQPQIGRLFNASDDRPGCGWEGAVVSHRFWQGELGGDPAVLSRTLSLDGHRVQIIGVTPEGFLGVEVGKSFDVAVPICTLAPRDLASRTFFFLSIVGRLRPDVTEAAARTDLGNLAPSLFADTLPLTYQPSDQAVYRAMTLDIAPGAAGQSEFRESLSRPLVYLQGMVALVLLLACANLANMMLARATAREHEFAVRRSMGATSFRLIQQVMVESLLLALGGAAVGSLVAPAIGRAMVSMLSTARDPIVVPLDPDPRTFLFAVIVATATTLVFGMAPAVRAGRAATRGASEGRGTLAFRRALLGGQVALCMVLLTAAFLFTQSFNNLHMTSPGFDADGVLVAHVFLDGERYPAASRPAAIETVFERVKALPGVTSAARASVIPIGGSEWGRSARVGGSEVRHDVYMNAISEGYFETMRTRLIAGRDFSGSDLKTSPSVAVVNEAFARLFFNGRSPMGETVRLTGSESESPPALIVGLVKDSKYARLTEPFEPIVFIPDRQREVVDTRVRMLIRASTDPASLANAVRVAMLDLDPQLSLRFSVLKTQLEESVLRERLMAALTGAFGALGMVLALTGVFGVTAYVVSRRYREFGVRMALGATRGGILRMILREIAIVVFVGIAAGGIVAAVAGGSMSAFLFGISGRDAGTLGAVALALAIGGLLAGVVPAMRASRVEPVDVLRV